MSATLPYRANADFLESKYADWKKDAGSVEPLWSSFFEGFELGMARLPTKGSETAGGDAAPLSEKTLNFRMRVSNALQSFRALGHTAAHLDPLDKEGPEVPGLTLAGLGFTADELEEDVQTHLFRNGQPMKLKTMLAELQRNYCGKTGFEFMHIHHPEVRAWLLDRIEGRNLDAKPAAQDQINALRWLLEAESFERFLHRRFVGQKRFSVEGGESMLVALETILEAMPAAGGKEIILGMAHRGRLSVLANFLRKPLEYLFYEFSENYVPNMVSGDGDVKYHLGFETVRQTSSGDSVGVMLAPNPSHLEAVDPVVEGMARARQRALNDTKDRKKVIPVLIHGDAAFAGQGLVAEVLNLSQLPGYRTGGTVHIIVNNQIGFTTMPEDARSSDYCTDVAKMIEAPVFHVNGDCPLEVMNATRLAFEFRQTFGRDVIVDIVCYRRYGHNETDEPGFTQPNMARAIAEHPSTATLFRLDLAATGVLDEAGAAALQREATLERTRNEAAMAADSKACPRCAIRIIKSSGCNQMSCVCGWRKSPSRQVPDTAVGSPFDVARAGSFEVEVWQGCGKGNGGSVVALDTKQGSCEFTVEETGHFQRFVPREVGKLTLVAGENTLTVRPVKKAKAAVMDLRRVILERVE
mgnify:CR=1 FL=1